MSRSTASLCLLGSLVACSGGKCPEPEYGGAASDEAYVSLLDAESRVAPDAAKAPTFSSPQGFTTFSAAVPPTFAWSSALTAAAAPAARPVAPARRRWFELLYGSAWAHQAPVTGMLTWLRFTATGKQCPPLEVLTSQTEFTPDAARWASLGGKSVTLLAWSAYLRENRITEGPYSQPTAPSFTVTR